MPLDRRRFIAISFVALGSAPLRGLVRARPSTRSGQGAAAQPAATFEPIRRNIGYITAQGGTIGWLIDRDAAVVVDTQYARSAPACVDALKQHGVSAIDLVFNTHHHADHTGGNGVFKPLAKKIVAQARVPELQRQAAAAQPNADPQVYADTTFETTWSERLANETITARYYGPAHTGGDSVITFERAEVVHLGDLVFNEVHPRIDRPGGASAQGWIQRLSEILKAGNRDTLYIVGHTKPGNPVVVKRDALQRQSSYLDALLSYVRKGIAGGKSKAELASIQALPGFESHVSLGQILTLENTINAAYDELTSK